MTRRAVGVAILYRGTMRVVMMVLLWCFIYLWFGLPLSAHVFALICVKRAEAAGELVLLMSIHRVA